MPLHGRVLQAAAFAGRGKDGAQQLVLDLRTFHADIVIVLDLIVHQTRKLPVPIKEILRCADLERTLGTQGPVIEQNLPRAQNRIDFQMELMTHCNYLLSLSC